MNEPTFPADPYAPKPKPFRVVAPPPGDMGKFGRAAVDDPSPTVEHDRDRTPTWLEFIADGVARLTYGEMKILAAGILGKDDQPEIIVLADRLHAWAEKAKVPQ